VDVEACECKKLYKEIILVLYVVMQVLIFYLLNRPIFYSFIYLTTLSVPQAVCTTPSPTLFCPTRL